MKITYKDILIRDRLEALRKQEEKKNPKKDNDKIRILYKVGDLWCLADYYNTDRPIFLTSKEALKHAASNKWTVRRKESKDVHLKDKARRTY